MRGGPSGPTRASKRSFWPRAVIGAFVAGVLLVLGGPRAATWWQHQLLASTASKVELPAACERTAERRDGEAIGIFATPPTLSTTYTCSGLSGAATRDAADAALRAGGFALEYSWRPENFTDTGPVEVSSWSGPGSRALAVVAGGRIELTLSR
jgi:hypothetical protein